MANGFQGSIDFTVGGKRIGGKVVDGVLVGFKIVGGEMYKARLGMHEIALLQDAYEMHGTEPVAIAAVINRRLKTLGDYITFGRIVLERAHPNITDTQVADLLDVSPYPGRDEPEIVRALRELVTRAFPDEEGSENPQKAPRLRPRVSKSS